MKAFGQDLDQIAVWEPGRSLALDDYGCFRMVAGIGCGVSEFLCVKRLRLVHGGVRALRIKQERASRWASRVMLRALAGEAVLVEHGKLIHGRLPVVCSPAPTGGDVNSVNGSIVCPTAASMSSPMLGT
jgi:hypothetical protein